MSKIKGLVSFQPTGAKIRKDNRQRSIENSLQRSKRNDARYVSLVLRAKKAQDKGFVEHAEKLRAMADQFYPNADKELAIHQRTWVEKHYS